MAVSGVLTKRSGELVEFQHVIASKTAQGNKDDLHCLSHSLKKLQSDVNSCLTEIIKQETTAVCGCAPDSGDVSEEEEDSDDEEDVNNSTKQPALLQEPQAKKIRI